MRVHEKFSPFGSAVWPASGNIYEFIEMRIVLKLFNRIVAYEVNY